MRAGESVASAGELSASDAGGGGGSKGACLDAIEAGEITADQIPPESGLNDQVIAALKVVADRALSDEWRWWKTLVGERGEYPILHA